MIVLRYNSEGGPGHVRLVTQAAHARLAGALARCWDVSLPQPVLEAIDQHDDPWIETDASLRLDEEGGVYDFMTLPLDERLALYTRGIDAMEDPRVALLTSLHYVRLIKGQASEAWVAHERARQRSLAAALALDDATLATHLDWLRFFDVLSLYVCMTPPGASAAGRPYWLSPEVFARDPQGRRFVPRWGGPEHLVLEGAPMEEVTFALPCTDRPLDERGGVDRRAAAASALQHMVITPG